MTSAEQTFRGKAPGIMALLMRDFGIGLDDAAAIMGNGGHESKGLTDFQEDKPVVPGSRGGTGWFMWTGTRRRAYEAYCARNNLDPASDKANYGFLFVELTGPEKRAIPAVIKAKGLAAKVRAFERAYERAGVQHYPSREQWAAIALDAYRRAAPVELPAWVSGRPVHAPLPPAAPQQPPAPEPRPEPPQGGFWAWLRSLFT